MMLTVTKRREGARRSRRKLARLRRLKNINEELSPHYETSRRLLRFPNLHLKTSEKYITNAHYSIPITLIH